MDEQAIRKTVATEIKDFFAGLFREKAAPGFSEADLTAKVDAMKKSMEGRMAEEIAAVKKEFAEGAKKAEASLTAATKTSALEKVKAFIAARVAANQWVPAFAEAKLDRVLEVLAAGQAVTFSEGEGDKKKDVTFGEAEAYAALTAFLEALPKIVPMGELAGAKHQAGKVDMPANLTKGTEVANIGIAQRARALMAESAKNGKTLSYAEASALVRAEFAESGADPNAPVGSASAGAA